MGKGFTMVEWRLIRDSLLKVTPGRDQADALWEVIEKINTQLGEHDEQRRKSASRNKSGN